MESSAVNAACGFRRWQCFYCGFIYDEATGDAEHGLAPGTRLEDFPDDWTCPECGAGKADFHLIAT